MGGFFNTLLAISTAGASIPITNAIDRSKKKDNGPSATPLQMPETPKPEDTAGKADEMIKRKRASMSQSIYTSPLGVSGEASVARKTLLGQ